MRAFQNLLKVLDRGMYYLSTLILFVMFGIIIVGVIFRYVILDPLVWTEEASRFLLAWLVFLTGSMVIRVWGNIRVTYLLEKLPERTAQIVEFVLKILVFVFLIYVFVVAWKVLPKVGMRETAPALNLKMIYAELSIPIGVGFMLLQLLGVLIGDISKLLGKEAN